MSATEALLNSMEDPAPATEAGPSRFAPFPEQNPIAPPLTGFSSIPSKAAAVANPKPYTAPPPYTEPSIVLGAGLNEKPPIRRIIDAVEEGKMRAEEVRSPGVVYEEEVSKLSVAELKKMGLGRVPSGEFSHNFPLLSFLLMII
jgi:histone deacetylase 6